MSVEVKALREQPAVAADTGVLTMGSLVLSSGSVVVTGARDGSLVLVVSRDGVSTTSTAVFPGPVSAVGLSSRTLFLPASTQPPYFLSGLPADRFAFSSQRVCTDPI